MLFYFLVVLYSNSHSIWVESVFKMFSQKESLFLECKKKSSGFSPIFFISYVNMLSG